MTGYRIIGQYQSADGRWRFTESYFSQHSDQDEAVERFRRAQTGFVQQTLRVTEVVHGNKQEIDILL